MTRRAYNRARWGEIAVSALIALAISCGPVHAIRPVKSLYTALDRTKCQVQDEQTGRRLFCRGLDGFPIVLSENAYHSYLSVGADAGLRRAARQTLFPANSVFPGNSKRSALEWRFIIRDARPVPYALIIRYFTKEAKRRGEVLVVMRVTETEACHVAHIDAVANPGAIMMARRIADREARQFDCQKDPFRFGVAGKSPM